MAISPSRLIARRDARMRGLGVVIIARLDVRGTGDRERGGGIGVRSVKMGFGWMEWVGDGR